MCGIPEEDFEFDFEKDLEDAVNDDQQEAYVFELVIDADDFDRVEIEDDTGDEEVRYANNVNEQCPTFNEMLAEEYLLKQKVVEEKQGDVPVVKESDIIVDRIKWFRDLKSERKFLRPFKFFAQHKVVSMEDIIRWC
ncbi:hypothetical protein HanRHA438_Chr05g0228651 [Helianthus annuus]|nr:hypothetical protein HanRHA438_Chr05g0228651 [Helianthus annuus]